MFPDFKRYSLGRVTLCSRDTCIPSHHPQNFRADESAAGKRATLRVPAQFQTETSSPARRYDHQISTLGGHRFSLVSGNVGQKEKESEREKERGLPRMRAPTNREMALQHDKCTIGSAQQKKMGIV